MSIWLLVFFLSVAQCSQALVGVTVWKETDTMTIFARDNGVADVTKDDRKITIGEQLDVIIKDVSDYLFWLFGYHDDEPIEDQIEVSEIISEGFLKDVNEMIDLMHEEADKHIKHAKDMKNVEDEENRKESDEKVNSEEEIPQADAKSSEETSDAKKEKTEQSDNIAVIPI